MKQKTFVSIDVESTGLDSRLDEILEIGAVKFREDGTIIKTYRRRFKSHFPIPKEATAVHGITDLDVLNERYYDERGAASAIKDMCEGMSLVGYNINFDLGFLKFSSVKTPEIIDVMEMTRQQLGRRISLESACKQMDIDVNDLLTYPRSGIKEAGYHSALTDALQTMRLFVKLKNPKPVSQTSISFLEPEEKPKEVVCQPIKTNSATFNMDWPQDKPSIFGGLLVIPFGCDKKYHWWTNEDVSLEKIEAEIKEGA